MALRAAVRRGLRRCSSKPGWAPPAVGADLHKLQAARSSFQSLGHSVKSFSPSTYFEEKYFWQKANVGPFFLLLFCTPVIYRSFKDFYWTRQLRKLNTEEVIADRYQWLKLGMLQDEVDAVLLKQVPASGVAPLVLGPCLPP
ncbi:unnamed protein product [Prorocentrum cordatum]|uniref:Uncharacterized protein n=1 Tax=Prorocentrum cordatum TaxID=2364126 RepID=A0ABN9VL82_9DINO|nr:unnamed protein product [Polarella glacialis]